MQHIDNWWIQSGGIRTKGKPTPGVKRRVKRQRQVERQNLAMGLGSILERHNAFQWDLVADADTAARRLILGVGIA